MALKGDPDLAGVVSKHGVPIILMHNRSRAGAVIADAALGNHYDAPQYDNLIEDIKRDLLESVEIAHKAHIKKDRIILDPGIGFGKTPTQNLKLVNSIQEIKKLGYPVLLGPSRKSFISQTLSLPPTQRVEGTAATVAVGIVRGVDIVRGT